MRKNYTEQEILQMNKLQAETDKRIIQRFLRMQNRRFEPEWDTWKLVDDKKAEYAATIKELDAAKAAGQNAEKPAELQSKLAETGRELQTAKVLYDLIGGYTCQPAEAKEKLRELLEIMEKKGVTAYRASKTLRNRELRAQGYKYNGRTKEWYLPKEG